MTETVSATQATAVVTLGSLTQSYSGSPEPVRPRPRRPVWP